MAVANWLLFTVNLIYVSTSVTAFCLLRIPLSLASVNDTPISRSLSLTLALSISSAAILFCAAWARIYAISSLHFLFAAATAC